MARFSFLMEDTGDMQVYRTGHKQGDGHEAQGFSVLNLKVGLLLERSSFLLDGFSAFLESLPHN